MKPKKIVKKFGKKLPGAKQYAQYRALNDENIGLRESVKRLENRNKLWEQEVRELRGDNKPLTIVWPVNPEDIVDADWRLSKKANQKNKKNAKSPFTINWVVPPVGPVSGGHADIFRTINYLANKGHKCRIYFYDALKTSPFELIQENLTHYPKINAELFYNAPKMLDCDAIFATNWHTAYPVFNYKSNAKKYYYVQDFEPYFEPVGAYSVFAENTYKFGLRGITLGSWLAEKLSKEYGMECDAFELGTDSKEYYLSNTKRRKKVLFYARPVTPRRGFELGVLSLELFHKQHPEYEIQLLGWDTKRYEIPFPYVNHGILSVAGLNKLYNECSAGLVLSFTNMSLLPLEMMASGCIPVINDAYHTRKVSYSDHLLYSLPTPKALSENLYKAASAKNQIELSKAAATYSKKFHWDQSNSIIEQILIKELSSN